MTPTLRLTRDDALLVIAALAEVHDTGLDRAMREDAEARDLLVGAGPCQEPSAYPAQGEVAIALALWIRMLGQSADHVTAAITAPRINLILAALTRFTRRYDSDGTRSLGSTSRVLDGSEFGLRLDRPVCPTGARTLRSRLLRGLIGRAIAT